MRKVWRQLQREGFDVARCTVARLMRQMGLQGVDPRQADPHHGAGQGGTLPARSREPGQFHAPAPNMLWLSDFTYVSTWSGFVYVAFVIDAYARRIVGWRV